MNKTLLRTIIFILFIIILVFGLIAPFLGFYHDDFLLMAAKVNNQDISFLFSVDRPLVGIFNAKAYSVFGNNPFYWHSAYILILLLCSIVFFTIMRIIVPKNYLFQIISTTFFTIYPGFLIYIKAVTHLPHLTSLFIALFSIFLLLKAFSFFVYSKRKIIYVIIFSIVSSILNFLYLGLVEYALGLEAFKLLSLIYLYLRVNKTSHVKLRNVFVIYTPSFITTILFLYWRFFIFQPKRLAVDQNTLLSTFLSSPIEQVLNVFKMTFSSFLHSTFLAFFINSYQNLLNSSIPSILITIAISLIVLSLIWVFFNKKNTKFWTISTKRILPEKFNILLSFSFIMIIAAIIPVVLSSRYINVLTDFNRYSLQLIPAISIFLTCIIFLIKNKKLQVVVFSLVIFSSVFTHITNQYQYIKKWEMQNNVWNQLVWRVPQFKDNSLVIIELPDGFEYAENFEIFGPLNQIYHPQNIGNMLLISEVLNEETISNIKNKTVYEKYTRTIPIVYDFNNMIIFSMPSENSCLHLISSKMPLISEYDTDRILSITEFSDSNLINLDNSFSGIVVLPFSEQSKNTWCYHFEQGSFYAQKGDWEKVRKIGRYVIENSIEPNDVSEYIPFLASFQSQESDSDYFQFILNKMQNNNLFLKKYCDYTKSLSIPIDSRFNAMNENLCHQY